MAVHAVASAVETVSTLAGATAVIARCSQGSGVRTIVCPRIVLPLEVLVDKDPPRLLP
jgi:hypothetical protein